MSPISYQASFRIAASHPALPGHFPGYPVVPGVVLLDRVAAALENWRGARISVMRQIKFLAPLLPEQEAELRLENSDVSSESIRFSIFYSTTLIANGAVEIVPIDPASVKSATPRVLA